MTRMLLADLLLLAAGNGVVVAVAGRARGAFGVVGRVALSFLCGVALLAVVTTLLAVTSLPTTPLPFTAPALLIAAGTGLLPLRRRTTGLTLQPPRAAAVGEAVALLPALFIGGRALRAARALPVITNDEYAIWAVRGRMLSLAGRFDDRIGLNAASGYQHTDYPLGLPALMAWTDGWAGRPDDAAAHAQVALVFIAMLLVGAWVGSRYAGFLGGVAAVLLLGGLVAALPRYAILMFGDIPVAAFSVAMVAVAVVWLDEGDARLLGIVGVLGAGAALTKNEGALAALAVLLGAAVASIGLRRGWRSLAAAGAIAAAALAPWMLFTRINGAGSDVANAETLSPAALVGNAHLVGPILDGFQRLWPGVGGPALLLPLAAAGLALGSGRWRPVALFATTIALVLCGLIVIYLSGFGHLNSSAHRTLLAPAAVLAIAVPVLAGCATKRPQEETS